jgi:outer membrane protein OmpA-like peptidoglycan-associated protein
MKNILIAGALLLGISSTNFAQTLSEKEKKGNDYYFVYDYEKAVEAYSQSKNLSTKGRRKLAECYAKVGDFKQAEVTYSYLVNNQDAVIPEDYIAYAYVLKSAGRDDDYAMWMTKFVQVAPNDLRGKSYVANIADYQKLFTDPKIYKLKSQAINSESQEYATAFYKDQIVFTSTKQRAKMIKRTDNWTGLPYSSLYVAKVENAELTHVKFLDKKLNSKMHDGPASFNAEGTKMVYTTDNHKDKSNDKIVELQLFTSDKINGKWSKPVAFKYNNSGYSNGQGFLLSDGKTMYFTSDMPGGYGGTDLYVTTCNDKNEWSNPVNLGNQVNTEGDEMFPFMDESNDLLFFASNGHFGLGGLDIFNSYKMNDQFGLAKNLGSPFNSQENDFAYISDSTHKGYLSSNRHGGKGSTDIYSFSMMKDAVLEKQIIGISMNTQGENLPETFIVLQDEKGKGIDSMLSDSQGSYFFKVDNDVNYTLIGRKKTYKNGTTNFNSFGLEEKIVADVILADLDVVEVIIENVITGVIAKNDTIKNVTPKDILTKKVELGQLIKLKPIYYEFDKAVITPAAAKELDKIVKMMNKYPNVEIELAAYTDCRGSIHYNEVLSQSRAAASIAYIQKRISKPNRIYGAGYGETNLLNACTCEGEVISTCTEIEHQTNRRTEFIIKK